MAGCAVYRGIGPEDGHIVEEKEAFQYALDRCLHGTAEDQRDFRNLLIELFYSGNWIKEDIHGSTEYL